MTGDVVRAARWLGLSLVASSVIVVVGMRWPSPPPSFETNFATASPTADDVCPQCVGNKFCPFCLGSGKK